MVCSFQAVALEFAAKVKHTACVKFAVGLCFLFFFVLMAWSPLPKKGGKRLLDEAVPASSPLPQGGRARPVSPCYEGSPLPVRGPKLPRNCAGRALKHLAEESANGRSRGIAARAPVPGVCRGDSVSARSQEEQQRQKFAKLWVAFARLVAPESDFFAANAWLQ